MRRVTVELPDDLFHAVEERARDRSTTVEDLLRDAARAVYASEAWETGEPTEEEVRLFGQSLLDLEDPAEPAECP